jgi:hypothetical protein
MEPLMNDLVARKKLFEHARKKSNTGFELRWSDLRVSGCRRGENASKHINDCCPSLLCHLVQENSAFCVLMQV